MFTNVIVVGVFCVLVCVSGSISPAQLPLIAPEIECMHDEYFSECGKSSEPTCGNPDPDTCYGPPKCICRRDLVRHDHTGNCVRQEECYKGPNPFPYPDYIPPDFPPAPDDTY